VELHGQRFTMAEKIGAMAFMRLASLAQDGLGSSDMDGLAALYDVCRAVFEDESWDRYRVMATRLRLGDEEIMLDVQRLVEAVGRRPTGRSSGSPAGPSPTPSVSPTGHAVPDTDSELQWALGQYSPSDRFPSGRPDLQVGVVDRWEATHPGQPLPALKAV
jgi:hypothetical protein